MANGNNGWQKIGRKWKPAEKQTIGNRRGEAAIEVAIVAMKAKAKSKLRRKAQRLSGSNVKPANVKPAITISLRQPGLNGLQ